MYRGRGGIGEADGPMFPWLHGPMPDAAPEGTRGFPRGSQFLIVWYQYIVLHVFTAYIMYRGRGGIAEAEADG